MSARHAILAPVAGAAGLAIQRRPGESEPRVGNRFAVEGGGGRRAHRERRGHDAMPSKTKSFEDRGGRTLPWFLSDTPAQSHRRKWIDQRAARAYVSIPAAVDQSTPVKRTTVLLAFAPSSAAMTLASTVSAHSLLVRPGSDS